MTPSAEIARLTRSVEYLDWSRNQFFRGIAAPLLWIPQWAIAIETWREEHGPRIGEWVSIVGEMEALCSLATFAYDRPSGTFPELVPELADGDRIEWNIFDLGVLSQVCHRWHAPR